MNTEFHKINIDDWDRKDEYEHFTKVAPCGFSMTADVDISNLYRVVKDRNMKLYPALVSLAAQVINEHIEYRFAVTQDGELGYYEVLHPLFFDVIESNKNIKVLCSQYNEDWQKQMEEIEAMREKYKNIDKYSPQGLLPPNVVNISCVPWVKFSNLSFCLPHSTYYFTPILTFGKFENKDGKILIPLSVHVNHAVNDGYHCSRLFLDFEEKISCL